MFVPGIPAPNLAEGAQVAVSDLMQQLKNGEISRMQLFQRIAKLQSAPTTSVKPSNPTSITIGPSQLSKKVSFVSTISSSTVSSFESKSSTFRSAFPAGAAGGSTSLGTSSSASFSQTQMPGNDNEFYQSGVTHDSGQQLSVQEWMESKKTQQKQQQQQLQQQPSITSQLHEILKQQFPPKPSSTVASLLASSMLNEDTAVAGTAHQDPLHRSSQRVEDQQAMNDEQQGLRYQEAADNMTQPMDQHDPEGMADQEILDQQQQEEMLMLQHAHAQELAGDSTPGGASSPRRRSKRRSSPRRTSAGANGGNNSDAENVNTKFHARASIWKSQKEAVREQMKQQLLQTELDECTFTPVINSKSTKVAAKLRKQCTQPVSERLYQEADNYKLREELAAKLKADEEAEIQRQCTFHPKILTKGSVAEKVSSKYMEPTKASLAQSPSKVLPRTPHRNESLAVTEKTAVDRELDKCTFAPKVNPIHRDMVSAQLYIKQNIYERLSRPATMLLLQDQVERHDEFDDDEYDLSNSSLDPRGGAAASRAAGDGAMRSPSARNRERRLFCFSDFHSSPLGGATLSQDDFYVRPSSPTASTPGCLSSRRYAAQQQQDFEEFLQRRRPHSAGEEDLLMGRGRSRGRAGDAAASANARAQQSRRFENFIERQKFHEQARRKKIETAREVVYSHHMTHKPQLNKQSVTLMENCRTGDFIERLDKYVLRKQQEMLKVKDVKLSDPNCTFRPRINTSAARRKARSVTEMSRGDLLRKETSQRLMKLKMEQEEMASLTFRPRLNRLSERVGESKLKILSSPDTYIQRLQQQNQATNLRQRRALQEKEMEEFAESKPGEQTEEAACGETRVEMNDLQKTMTLVHKEEATDETKQRVQAAADRSEDLNF